MTRFRLNTPAVVSDVIDGEVVAIHLDQGNYYSLRGSAVEVWEMVRAGLDLDSAITVLEAQYTAPDDSIRAGVVAFAHQLLAEGLIVPAEHAVEETPPSLPSSPSTEVRPFEAPALERYTDMRDFLLVDPIHEVDVTEWPQPARRNSS